MPDTPVYSDSDRQALRSSVDTIVQRIVGVFAPEPTDLAQPGDMLMRDLGFNSLRLMELAFTLEDLFAMDPAAVSEAPAAGTVADLSDYLADLVASAEATLPTPEAVEAAVAGL